MFLRRECPLTLRRAADNTDNARLAEWLRTKAHTVAGATRDTRDNDPSARAFDALMRRARDVAQDERAFRILGLPLALASESDAEVSDWFDEGVSLDEALSLLSEEERGEVRQQAYEFADLFTAAMARLGGGITSKH